MPTDLYTKVVLTIIAIGVGVIAYRGGPTIHYSGMDCGTVGKPCYVATPTREPIDVRVR